MSTKDLMSLVGETMHLSTCGTFIGAILASDSAEWWAPIAVDHDLKETATAKPTVVKRHRMF